MSVALCISALLSLRMKFLLICEITRRFKVVAQLPVELLLHKVRLAKRFNSRFSSTGRHSSFHYERSPHKAFSVSNLYCVKSEALSEATLDFISLSR
jgi:hypothetical protein